MCDTGSASSFVGSIGLSGRRLERAGGPIFLVNDVSWVLRRSRPGMKTKWRLLEFPVGNKELLPRSRILRMKRSLSNDV